MLCLIILAKFDFVILVTSKFKFLRYEKRSTEVAEYFVIGHSVKYQLHKACHLSFECTSFTVFNVSLKEDGSSLQTLSHMNKHISYYKGR